jgi:CheY-like chemotaxis protein
VTLPLPVSIRNQYDGSRQHRVEVGHNDCNRVLIADDSEINLLLLANMLEQHGCIVDSAKNGKEALQLISEQHYQMALIDLNMPVMTGLELVKTIRSQNNPLIIAAISAYADENKITEALNAGFDYYLTKPLDEAYLLKMLKDIARQEKERDDIKPEMIQKSPFLPMSG